MTQEEIIEANRKSALEQVEQDERNEDLKAEMIGAALANSRYSASRRDSCKAVVSKVNIKGRPANIGK
jgi:hypothetical protein